MRYLHFIMIFSIVFIGCFSGKNTPEKLISNNKNHEKEYIFQVNIETTKIILEEDDTFSIIVKLKNVSNESQGIPVNIICGTDWFLEFYSLNNKEVMISQRRPLGSILGLDPIKRITLNPTLLPEHDIDIYDTEIILPPLEECIITLNLTLKNAVFCFGTMKNSIIWNMKDLVLFLTMGNYII